jgi:ubiquinone biosynthesis UbiH/UbiF/VisC/COQ6 family hydroxylase
LGIHIESTDYAHTAIIANITTSEPHHGKAYERFTDNGPMALLPMLSIEKNQYRSALIWTMPHAEAVELMSVSDDVFLQKLQMRFGYRQGQFTAVGQRHAYPLMLSVATEQVRQHIAVLGNAAHSLHPVAGQGFNLALRDVNALCKVLNEAYELSLSIGELEQLQKYFSAQKNDQQLTTLFSDVLPQLFSRPQRVIKMGRGFGLVSLEVLPHLKSSFVRFATGMRVNA